MMRLCWVLVLSALALSACSHRLSLHSRDGEHLQGRYRFARDDSGLIQVAGAQGEILNGKFVRVGRAAFIESFKKTFGSESISVSGPDLAAHGHGLGASFGSSYMITDTAQGETFSAVSGKAPIKVTGPLFYWTASLSGNRGTTMACYLIGSSYTRSGFGRCKTHNGNEYSVEF